MYATFLELGLPLKLSEILGKKSGHTKEVVCCCTYSDFYIAICNVRDKKGKINGVSLFLGSAILTFSMEYFKEIWSNPFEKKKCCHKQRFLNCKFLSKPQN